MNKFEKDMYAVLEKNLPSMEVESFTKHIQNLKEEIGSLKKYKKKYEDLTETHTALLTEKNKHDNYLCDYKELESQREALKEREINLLRINNDHELHISNVMANEANKRAESLMDMVGVIFKSSTEKTQRFSIEGMLPFPAPTNKNGYQDIPSLQNFSLNVTKTEE